MRTCFPDGRSSRLSGDEFVIIAMNQEYEVFMKHVREMGIELDSGAQRVSWVPRGWNT